MILRRFSIVFIYLLCTCASFPLHAIEKKLLNIAIVSSYHPDYTWSQETNKGVLAALLDFSYLDNRDQAQQFTKTGSVISSRVTLRKYWMDTKRKSSRSEISITLSLLIEQLNAFKPDIVLLGDDNAANYVGNHYLDSDIPVVFWGVNGAPLKYGLLDSLEKPGHNITGVYQAGYHKESIIHLKTLIPGIKRMAVLSDDSPTGRSHAKRLQRYAIEGLLPVEVVDVVITNSFSEFKKSTLALNKKVDAFFISTHNTLKDDAGNHVDYLAVINWYLKNTNKPEVTPSSHMLREGLLATVDDSGFNQGYEAVKVSHSILSGGKNPAEISVYAPKKGPFIVNEWRAKQLGLQQNLKDHEKIIDNIIYEHRAWK